MKKGVRIINCARGGIIDENALAQAIEQGIVAQCAIDVYEDEKHVDKSPLIALGSKAILTPHLGASTDEAQVNVALDVANQVVEVLSGGNATSAINIPALKPQKIEAVKEFMKLAENIAQIASQLSSGAIKNIKINVSGKLINLDVSPLEIAILKGVLSPNILGVNYVNAPIVAKERDIELQTSKTTTKHDYIEVIIEAQNNTTLVRGELIASGVERIVQLNNYITSIEPKKNMLFVPHINKPNMVAQVASVLGRDNVNISGMQVAQAKDGIDKSIMVINVDSETEQSTLDKISSIDGVDKAVYISL